MLNTILDSIKNLDVQYIVFNGYYSNKDDGEELQKHTNETYSLYLKGLDAYQGDWEKNDDVFNGVCFDTDGTPLAEWWIDGTEEYLKID